MKPFSNIMISSGISHPTPSQCQHIKELHHFFNHLSIPYVAHPSWALLLDAEMTPKEQPPSPDTLLIIVGGDGSFLRLKSFAHQYQLPILGVNLGRLGFLTDLSPQHCLSMLPDILNGHYSFERRSLLSINIHKETYIALNEVTLKSAHSSQIISAHLSIHDRPIFHQKSDGLIIATPTGSTAYNMSAGGPIVHPQLAGFIITPICPHRLNSRPMIIPSSCDLTLKSDDKATVTIDGHHSLILQQENVRIHHHPQPVTLIHPVTYDYYDVLQKKLNWETDVTPPPY